MLDTTRKIDRRTTLTLVAAAAVLALPGATVEARSGAPGAVYTMSNAAEGNEVLAFRRGPDGALFAAGAFPTGGLGAGEGLGNQAGVVLSRDGRRLFVVNAGSNDVSAFEVRRDGLVLTDVEPSLGERPVSVAADGDLLYVLNAGGAGSIQGFTLDHRGELEPLADSMRPLSGAAMTAPAQIGFSPDGGILVVTEKATSLIDTFVVGSDGRTSGPSVFASSGMTPFGFDFSSRGDLLVSEAFGGDDELAAASSYALAPDGTLAVTSATVPCFQTAACWLVVSRNGRFAYVTNTGSGTVSGYEVHKPSGAISLLDDGGETADAGAGTRPIDASFSRDGRFLYVLLAGTHEIAMYRAHGGDGTLTHLGTLAGLPETTNGLAAR